MRVLKSVREHLENYHLKAGIFHFFRGEFGPAAEFFQKALDEGRLSVADRRSAIYFLVQTRISAAELHQTAGRLDRAVSEYRAALAVKPSYPDVHARLADALLARGDVAKAITHLEAAVELSAGFVDAWIALGRAHLRSGAIEPAREAFRAALSKREAAARRALEEAEKALELEDTQSADELYRHVFLENEDAFRHQFRQGLLLLRQEKWEDAAAALAEAAALRPRYADVHNYLGVARAELGDCEAASASFRRSVEINPEYLVAWLNLAYTLHAAGDPAGARRALEQVLGREADNAPARRLAGQLEDATSGGSAAGHHGAGRGE